MNTPEEIESRPEEKIKARAAEIPSSPPAPEATKGSLGGRILRHTFSPNTRTGRVMRPLVRGVGFFVGAFALGLLATYLLLYQPMERKYRAAAGMLAATQGQLESTQEELRKSALVLVGSESDRKSSATALEKTAARLALAQALNHVQETRIALAAKDSAAAHLALTAAEKGLRDLQPSMLRLASANPDNLTKVLDLTKGDLDRDAGLAEQDLRRLISELTLIDQALQ
jgi:hypothetical protein